MDILQTFWPSKKLKTEMHWLTGDVLADFNFFPALDGGRILR